MFGAGLALQRMLEGMKGMGREQEVQALAQKGAAVGSCYAQCIQRRL